MLEKVINKRFNNYVSLISPVYNSHQIFREQLLYLNSALCTFDHTVEVIFVDDGSNPSLRTIFKDIALKLDSHGFTNFRILETTLKIPWNQLMASNLGAKKARGSYLLFFDIDHIISWQAVKELLEFKGNIIRWKRINGVLEEGKIKTDIKTLLKYGASLDPKSGNRIRKEPFGVANTYGIAKDIFLELGGYNEDYCGYYNYGDNEFHEKLTKKYGEGYKSDYAILYVYPNAAGSVNKGLFHDLPRVIGDKNISYKK